MFEHTSSRSLLIPKLVLREFFLWWECGAEPRGSFAKRPCCLISLDSHFTPEVPFLRTTHMCISFHCNFNFWKMPPLPVFPALPFTVLLLSPMH